MKKTIWFDMDGTIADFYGVDNWLDYLVNGDTFPYLAARPLCNFSLLARYLHKVQKAGWEIGIISWTSKGGSEEYNVAVEAAKRLWLARHLPTIAWDRVYIVRYGTSKIATCGGGILFDDEEGNRKEWGMGAYSPDKILEILKKIS